MTTRTRDYLLRKLERRSRGTARKDGALGAIVQSLDLGLSRSEIGVWVGDRWMKMELPIKGLKCMPCGSRLVRVIRLVRDGDGRATRLEVQCSTCGNIWYSKSRHALRHHRDDEEQRR